MTALVTDRKDHMTTTEIDRIDAIEMMKRLAAMDHGKAQKIVDAIRDRGYHPHMHGTPLDVVIRDAAHEAFHALGCGVVGEWTRGNIHETVMSETAPMGPAGPWVEEMRARAAEHLVCLAVNVAHDLGKWVAVSSMECAAFHMPSGDVAGGIEMARGILDDAKVNDIVGRILSCDLGRPTLAAVAPIDYASPTSVDDDGVPRYTPLPVPEATTWGESGGAKAIVLADRWEPLHTVTGGGVPLPMLGTVLRRGRSTVILHGTWSSCVAFSRRHLSSRRPDIVDFVNHLGDGWGPR